MGNKLRHEGDEVRIKVIWPDIIHVHIKCLQYISKWCSDSLHGRTAFALVIYPQNMRDACVLSNASCVSMR